MTITLSLLNENFGDAETAWDTWTLHCNIALTKVFLCFTIFTDGTSVWNTHSHIWQPDKNLASKYLCVQESCRGDSYVVYCQIFPTGQRQMLYGWYYYTVYIYHRHLPHLKSIHNKVRKLVRGERCVYTSVFSNMPSFHNFLPAAGDNWRLISVFFFFLSSQIQDFGFWMKTNAFPSVREICSSNGCIRDESFCSLPKPKSQLTYHSNSHP